MKPALEERPVALDVGAPAPAEPVEVRPRRERATLAYWTLVISHLVVDLYPIFIFALAASIQANLSLTEAQIAAVLAIGPVISETDRTHVVVLRWHMLELDDDSTTAFYKLNNAKTVQEAIDAMKRPIGVRSADTMTAFSMFVPD